MQSSPISICVICSCSWQRNISLSPSTKSGFWKLIVDDKPLPVSSFDGDSKTFGGVYRLVTFCVFFGGGVGSFIGMSG
jgi:hypothetical protein